MSFPCLTALPTPAVKAQAECKHSTSSVDTNKANAFLVHTRYQSLGEAFCLCFLIQSPLQTSEVDIMMFVFPVRKLRLSEAKQISQQYSASR